MEAKERKLKPQNSNGLAASMPKILQDATVKINSREAYSLILILNGMRAVNNALPPSATKFIAKNLKKLTNLQDKFITATLELENQYAEKDVKGRVLYWDGFDKRTNAAGEEIQDDEQAVNGIKAYRNKDKTGFIDTYGFPVPPQKANKLKQYVIGEEKELEYDTKWQELSDERRECHVIQINDDYLEDNRIQLPTRTGQNQALNHADLFEYLIIDGATLPE